MTHGQLEKLAMRYYEQLIDEIELVQDESDGWEATTYYAGAAVLQDRDLPKDALKEINKALKLEPDESNFYYIKAEILNDL